MTSVGALSRHQRLTGGMTRKDRKMTESAAQKKARLATEAEAAAAAEQKAADEAAAAAGQKAADEAAAAADKATPSGDVGGDPKANGTGEANVDDNTGSTEADVTKPEAKDVNDKTPSPDIKGVATPAEAEAQREERGEKAPDNVGGVQAQRDAEAAAAARIEGIRRGDLDAEGNAVERSAEEQALLAAAPGGERTLLTGSTEGSTMVKDTAAFPSPASGPLHDPVNDITNLRARDDDPDNRVYGDAAGPRDVELTGVSVETQSRIVDGNGAAPVTRFLDADGKALSYDDIFIDEAGKTFVTTKVRVREAFVYPNTETVGYRIAYTEGKKVPRGEAENVRRMIEGDNR